MQRALYAWPGLVSLASGKAGFVNEGTVGMILTSHTTEPETVTTGNAFNLTIHGVGLDHHNARIKIVRAEDTCDGYEIAYMDGLKCTTPGTCSPAPEFTSDTSATFGPITVHSPAVAGSASGSIDLKACYCPGKCSNPQQYTPVGAEGEFFTVTYGGQATWSLLDDNMPVSSVSSTDTSKKLAVYNERADYNTRVKFVLAGKAGETYQVDCSDTADTSAVDTIEPSFSADGSAYFDLTTYPGDRDSTVSLLVCVCLGATCVGGATDDSYAYAVSTVGQGLLQVKVNPDLLPTTIYGNDILQISPTQSAMKAEFDATTITATANDQCSGGDADPDLVLTASVPKLCPGRCADALGDDSATALAGCEDGCGHATNTNNRHECFQKCSSVACEEGCIAGFTDVEATVVWAEADVQHRRLGKYALCDGSSRLGTLVVSNKFRRDVTYLLEAATSMSIEVQSRCSLTPFNDYQVDTLGWCAPRDRMLIVDCKQQCGAAGPSAGVRKFTSSGGVSTMRFDDFRDMVPSILYNNTLQFDNLALRGGDYKVCMCDSDLLPDYRQRCTEISDYSVEVGHVHVTALSCALVRAQHRILDCEKMSAGGQICNGRPPADVASAHVSSTQNIFLYI